MSNLSISQLPSSSGLTGTEVLPIVQSGTTVQTTVQDVANLGGGGIMAAGTGTGSTIRINNGNCASGNYSTVIGGKDNTASGNCSTIGGGSGNSITRVVGIINSVYNKQFSGELNNSFNNISPTSTSSGLGTGAEFYFAFNGFRLFGPNIQVGGSDYQQGDELLFDGTLFGGESGVDDVTFQINVINKGDSSTIGGGINNTSDGGICSTIGGGSNNTANGYFSTIGGGNNNTTNVLGSTVGGGCNNTIGIVSEIWNFSNVVYLGDTLNNGFGNISPTSTSSGLGSGAKFGFQFIEGILDSISIQSGGSNYQQNDILTFDGTLFDGESGVDNVTLQIDVRTRGQFSIINGGNCNTACGDCSTIGGGYKNLIPSYGCFGTIGGGRCNRACRDSSTVGGGRNNRAQGDGSTIGGGRSNCANCYSTIGGGANNFASCYYSTISGGKNNSASGCHSIIGGGNLNTSSGQNSTVGGGCYNCAFGNGSTVSGGQNNTVGGYSGIIENYYDRTYLGDSLNGYFSDISPTSTSSGLGSGAQFEFEFNVGVLQYVGIQNGGSGYQQGDELIFDGTLFGGESGVDDVILYINVGVAAYSTVGGGSENTASGEISTIGGGAINTASGGCSTVGGGNRNTASGYRSTIGGGYGNTSSCFNSTIGGGHSNTSSGVYSTVGGGRDNRASSANSTIGGGNLNTTGIVGVIDGYFNETYTGNSLNGTFSNISPSSTLSGLGSGAQFEFEFIEGTLDFVDIQIGGSNYVNGDTLTFDGTLFGGESGIDDVTLSIETETLGYNSTIGGGASNTASGGNSTIGGGFGNIASGYFSTIGGGRSNTSSGCYSTIGGGYGNTTSGYASTIGGGTFNITSGYKSIVGGGNFNTASGCYSTIGGGKENEASGFISTIGGGCSNTSNGEYSTIGGGIGNCACGNHSTVGGGNRNISSGACSTVGGGYGNISSGQYSFIGGGGGYDIARNTSSGCHTAILGGRNNSTNNCNCAMIIGSCITAIATCTTHVNCLAIMNIPTSSAGLCPGMVWRNGNVLNIV